MTTVHNKEQEIGFEKLIVLTLHKHTADVDTSELSGHRRGRSHQPSPILVLARSYRLHQAFFMSLRSGTDRIFDVVDLGNGESDILACVTLWAEVANCCLLPSRIVVRRNLDDVFDIALSDGHLGSGGA